MTTERSWRPLAVTTCHSLFLTPRLPLQVGNRNSLHDTLHAMHLLIRSSYFPTPREHMLWYVSSVVVMCSGLVLVLLDRVLRYFSQARYCRMVVKTLILVYMLPSGFNVVECFRQLFFLESTAYQLPSWSNYWPHFS